MFLWAILPMLRPSSATESTPPLMVLSMGPSMVLLMAASKLNLRFFAFDDKIDHKTL